MRRCTFLLPIVLGVCACGQAAVSITPGDPTPSDEVSVSVSYWMPTGGYSIDHVVRRIVGSVIRLDLYWISPAPDAVVTQACVLHEHTESLGKLRAGSYMVQVIHRGISSLGESRSFTVRLFNTATGPDDENPCDCICHRWPASARPAVCPFCGCVTELPSNGAGNDTLHSLILRLMGR